MKAGVVDSLWRTALALTGDPAQAERLTAQALARHGDSRDAYFTLYRRFLRWRPERRERAAVVGLRHDGWSEENVADLLGWDIEKVRSANSSAQVQVAEETAQPLDAERVQELVRSYKKRRFTMTWAGILGTVTAMVALLAVATPEAPQNIAYPPPSPPYVQPTLPTGLPKGPIRYAYLPDDGDCVFVTSSGTRGTMPGQHGDVLKISQNGLRIAHYARGILTLIDATNGRTKELPLKSQPVLDLSLDGRYVAYQQGNGPTTVVDLRRPGKPATYPGESILGWTRRGLVTMGEETFLRRPDGSKESATAGSAPVSADGTMSAQAEDRQPKVYVENSAGKSRTFTMKDDNVLTVERWVGSSGVIVRMQHGGYRLIDVKTGKVSPVDVGDADYSPVAFGKLT